MKSQSLAAVIGKFEKAELLLFGSRSFQIDKGNEGSAAFNARVIGTNGNIVVDVMMTKSNDIWLVDQVLTSGRPVDTKNTK